jgi:hypothetical protein
MKLVGAPPTFISATLQPQVEDFQNENRKFLSGCECASHCLNPIAITGTIPYYTPLYLRSKIILYCEGV